MALAQAEAGADFVGRLGDDGRPGRRGPAGAGRGGLLDTAVFAYAAKYASAFYGPFREAVDSALVGDRRTYQQDPANRREAAREVALDIAEGADLVMVKPAMSYLDVLVRRGGVGHRSRCRIPGVGRVRDDRGRRGQRLDRPATGRSASRSRRIRRAGAQIVLTYWAAEIAAELAAGTSSDAADVPFGVSDASGPDAARTDPR